MPILSGAALPTTSLRSPEIVVPGGLDANVQQLKDAMDAAGELYIQAEIDMLDAYATSMKAAGLWDKMHLIWAPIGTSYVSALRCLKHPSGSGYAMTDASAQGYDEFMWNRNSGLTDMTQTSRPSFLNTDILGSFFEPFTSHSVYLSVRDVDLARNSSPYEITSWNFYNAHIRYASNGLTSWRVGGLNTAMEDESVSGNNGFNIFGFSLKGGNVRCTVNGTEEFFSTAGNTTARTAAVGDELKFFGYTWMRLDYWTVGEGLEQAEMATLNTIAQQLKTDRIAL